MLDCATPKYSTDDVSSETESVEPLETDLNSLMINVGEQCQDKQIDFEDKHNENDLTGKIYF